MTEKDPNWERQTLEKLAFAALNEHRRARYWGIFFKLLTFAYVTFILAMALDWHGEDTITGGSKHTALVTLEGMIESKGDASADRITGALQSAFEDKNTQGVIMRINSPGGSPVQSGIINDEIRRLRTLFPNIPFYVVIEDICASGGYFVAAAADKIYVNKASLVGSIGVLMNGFGFTGAMDKIGVERRLITAGENKGFLDPFSPVEAKQKEFAQVMIDDIHQQFIAVVKQGRGKRLKDNPDTFSGLIWTGQRSIEMGLADDYGTVDSVARDVIKAKDIIDYTQKANIAERFAKRFGAGVAQGMTGFSMSERFSLR